MLHREDKALRVLNDINNSRTKRLTHICDRLAIHRPDKMSPEVIEPARYLFRKGDWRMPRAFDRYKRECNNNEQFMPIIDSIRIFNPQRIANNAWRWNGRNAWELINMR